MMSIFINKSFSGMNWNFNQLKIVFSQKKIKIKISVSKKNIVRMCQCYQRNILEEK